MNTKMIDELYYTDEIRAQIASAEVAPEEKQRLLQRALDYYRQRASELEGVPEEINKYLREHEQEVCRGYVLGRPTDQLRGVLNHYRGMVTNALASSERFRDDLHAWLRGMVICLEMTGNADTHKEKNARLRGAIEITEDLIRRVINQRFNFEHPYWRWKDTFASDFPTREIMRRKNELEEELKETRRQLAEAKGEKVEDQPAEPRW